VTQESSITASGHHFSCSLSATLLARVHAYGGDEVVAELLRRARSPRSAEYLRDITNWISYDEAVALWETGAAVTHHPQFARAVGEDAVHRLAGSPVAALLRSLGLEGIYREMATTATKYSTASTLHARDVRPGFAEIVAVAVEGFPRNRHHCEWTWGLLSCNPILFGLPRATVEHTECQALGAPSCVYRVTWVPEPAGDDADASGEVAALRQQLDAMRERLRSVFATASDLIAADDISEILTRITDRAALEVRAPRYMLAVRMTPGGRLHCHHRGFDEAEVETYAEQVLERHPAAHPDSSLVVPVRSNRRDYGRLVAMSPDGQRFFAQERELFEVYARYAASALDGASALIEAQQRYDQSSVLLNLARALAAAGTSGEVAARLAEAVPSVVDCDRVSVFLWDATRGELVRRARTTGDGEDASERDEWRRAPTPGGQLETLLSDPGQGAVFVDLETGDPQMRDELARLGDVASILVPLATEESLLGLLAVAVVDRPERMKPTPDLIDRVSGVAAQATTALQNGHLVDQITYQALYDQLTGLANRVRFIEELRSAIQRGRRRAEHVTVFYIDLDGFKPVNDELGHDAGDRLLKAVAMRLDECVRASDVVARLGGDEFAVVTDSHPSPHDADTLADRLRAVFDPPFCIDGRDIRIGASIGRATSPGDAETADELIRRADDAMFTAKRSGRTRSR
jgi:diguanylate cyclase (GGDEF)-like protein